MRAGALWVLFITVFSVPSSVLNKYLLNAWMNIWMNVSCAFSATAWAPVLNKPSAYVTNADTHLTLSPLYSISFQLGTGICHTAWGSTGSPPLEHFPQPRFCLILACSPLLALPPPTLYPHTPRIQGLSTQGPLWLLLEPSLMVWAEQTLDRWWQIMSSLFLLEIRFLICLTDMNGKHG